MWTNRRLGVMMVSLINEVTATAPEEEGQVVSIAAVLLQDARGTGGAYGDHDGGGRHNSLAYL